LLGPSNRFGNQKLLRLKRGPRLRVRFEDGIASRPNLDFADVPHPYVCSDRGKDNGTFQKSAFYGKADARRIGGSKTLLNRQTHKPALRCRARSPKAHRHVGFELPQPAKTPSKSPPAGESTNTEGLFGKQQARAAQRAGTTICRAMAHIPLAAAWVERSDSDADSRSIGDSTCGYANCSD
jgi:hypothetical protein